MASTVNGDNGDTNQLLQLLQYRNQNPDQSLWALSRRYGYSSIAAATSNDDVIVCIVDSFCDKISQDENPLSYFKDTESFERTKGSKKYLNLKKPVWGTVCNAMEEGIKLYLTNTYQNADDLKSAVERIWAEQKVNYLYTCLLGHSL